MPQHVQHSLVHLLLLWITLLSIVQVVFIAFFFSAGHHGPSQNSSAVASQRTKQIQPNSSPSPSADLGKGKMLTFQCDAANGEITWKSKNSELEIVSEKGSVLTVKEDGYFFVSLQVTLISCQRLRVSLKGDNKVILQGSTDNVTCSTGLLGKVEDLSAGCLLEVTVEDEDEDEDEGEGEGKTPAVVINESPAVTHLDIIYLFKPSR